MSSVSDVPTSSAAAAKQHVASPVDAQAAAASPRYGPRGAFVLAGISTGLLFIGWLAFYFFLFIPRGSVG
jgi:hypothetical protein